MCRIILRAPASTWAGIPTFLDDAINKFFFEIPKPHTSQKIIVPVH